MSLALRPRSLKSFSHFSETLPSKIGNRESASGLDDALNINRVVVRFPRDLAKSREPSETIGDQRGSPVDREEKGVGDRREKGALREEEPMIDGNDRYPYSLLNDSLSTISGALWALPQKLAVPRPQKLELDCRAHY